MKIIIAGAGKVGHSVAALLAEEGHDLTIIDRDPETIQHISPPIPGPCGRPGPSTPICCWPPPNRTR